MSIQMNQSLSVPVWACVTIPLVAKPEETI